jgi:hypothetical protein
MSRSDHRGATAAPLGKRIIARRFPHQARHRPENMVNSLLTPVVEASAESSRCKSGPVPRYPCRCGRKKRSDEPGKTEDCQHGAGVSQE